MPRPATLVSSWESEALKKARERIRELREGTIHALDLLTEFALGASDDSVNNVQILVLAAAVKKWLK